MASPADQGATVAWGPPTSSGGSAIAGYMVKVYKTTPTLTYVKEMMTCASCTSTAISGLTNGQGYRFDVFARNSLGYGASATSNTVTAGGSADLLKPTGLQVSHSSGEATVTWIPPTVRLAGLTTYVIKAFADSSPTVVAATTTVTDPSTTATVTGLTNGRTYVVTVTASTLLVINVESDRSAPFVPAGPPLAPTNVTAARSDMKATVTWPTTNDNGSPITGYEIAVVNPTTEAELWVEPAIGSGAEVDGLTNGIQYAFKVRATNGLGTGPYSAVSSAITPAGRPYPPESVEATPGTGQVTVTWTPPPTQSDGTPGDNGETVTSYVVTVSPGAQSITRDGETRSITVDALDNGTTYAFLVTANNAFGPSDPSVAMAIPVAPPTTPMNVVATPRDGAALVRWDYAGQSGAPVTYTVTASPGGQSASTMSTSTLIDGLNNGQQYTFTVQAANSAGSSIPSSPSVAVTPQLSPPPSNIGCESSPLPPPPAEVRYQRGEIRRGIDVLCQPGAGRVRIGLFITDENVTAFPFSGITIARGDGRDFDAGMVPDQNRIYIEIDFSRGTGYIHVERSCPDSTETNCIPAKSLMNAFSSQMVADGSVLVHFSIGESLIEDHFIKNNVEISGDLHIIPMPGNEMCVMGSASRYPSIEAYHDLPSGTETLFTESQSFFGPYMLALPDRGVSGCSP